MKNTLKSLLGGKKSIKSITTTPMPKLPSPIKHNLKPPTKKVTAHRTDGSSTIQKNFKNFVTEYDTQFKNIEKVKQGLKSDEEIFKLMYLKKLI